MRSLKVLAGFAAFAVVSLAQAPPPTINGSCPGAIQFGSNLSLTLTASGGFPQNGYLWSMQQSSASWISVSPSSGATTQVSGTPPSPGAFLLAVVLQNPGTGTSTFSCVVTVNPPPTPLAIAGSCPASVVPFGGTYTAGFTGTGGNGIQSYVWSLSGPSWLSLSSNTGGGVSVSGAAPRGSPAVSYTLTLNDQSLLSFGPTISAVVTRTCQVQTTPVLTPTFACPGSAPADTLFQYALSATGGVPPYTFSVAAGSLPTGLTLNPATGLIVGTPSTAGSSPITFRVTDSGTGLSQQASNVACTFTVAPPRFPPLVITSQCPAAASIGSPYSHSFTSTGGGGGLQWTVAAGSLPDGLMLRGSTITGSAAGPAGSTPIMIQVSSADDQIATQSCTLQVTAPAPTITSACPPDGMMGVGYGPFTVTTRGGGTASPVFTVLGGELPAGLTLSNGVIAGTPSGPPGVATFSIRAAFGTAGTATLGPCSLQIATGPPSIGGTCPTSAQVGVPLSIPAAPSGGTPPYQFTFSGSPWLSFADGTVSGTPSGAGTGTYTLTVSDAANQRSKPLACSFPVTLNLDIAGQCPATSAEVNAPFTTALAASGGNGEYLWSITGDPWLSLSGTTGANISVNGTPPAAGTFPFSVTLRDSLGTPARTLSCSLSVAAPRLRITPGASCPTSPVPLLSPVSFSVAADGGAAPYRWSISGPSWLTLSSAAGAQTTASGSVASAPGNYSFTITLQDGAGSEPASVTCSLTVAPLPQPTISGPATGGSGRDQTIDVALPQTVPAGVRGRLTLTFAGDRGLPNDPAIQFSNGSRTLDFTTPTPPQPVFKLGTVAGVITIVPTFTAGPDNTDVTPPGIVPYSIRIDRAAPVITSVDCLRTSGTSFTVIVDGYTNTREMTTATFRFQPAGSATLGTTELSGPIGSQYDAWFNSATGQAAGGTFRSTHIFNTQGNASDVGSVAVQLTNSVGTSGPLSVSCRVQ